MELATQESRGILIDSNPIIDDFLCRALRGERASWAEINAHVGTEEFLKRAEHHGVMSLLYHRVQPSDEWTGWPGDMREALEQASFAGVAQEMLRAHHLEKILAEFDRQEVRCLLMKGEALALTHYSIPGTRARCDCDLFIHLDDIAAAKRAITAAGLKIVSPVFKTHQFTVIREADEAGAIQFDVHWRILNHPRFARVLSFDEAFQASLEVPGMEKARMLKVADALLVTCLHRLGSQSHDPDRLIWIHDIHVLQSSMTEEQLVNFAETAVDKNVQAICLDGLERASEYFGSAFSAQVMQVLRTPALPDSWSRRFSDSDLGLLLGVWWRV